MKPQSVRTPVTPFDRMSEEDILKAHQGEGPDPVTSHAYDVTRYGYCKRCNEYQEKKAALAASKEA